MGAIALWRSLRSPSTFCILCVIYVLLYGVIIYEWNGCSIREKVQLISETALHVDVPAGINIPSMNLKGAGCQSLTNYIGRPCVIWSWKILTYRAAKKDELSRIQHSVRDFFLCQSARLHVTKCRNLHCVYVTHLSIKHTGTASVDLYTSVPACITCIRD